MSDVTTLDNKRIARNTILLYVRMFFTMAITLYTSRVILKTLGVEDFGIFNAVGGFVGMLGFLNSAMAVSTQRYLTFALGKNDLKYMARVFTTAVQIHFILATILLIICEVVGLWFLYYKMIIPPERMAAANCVLQCSILSTSIMIVSVPYNAIIIAYEKMSAFAYISIFEVLMKLFVVYLLSIVSVDKLILYSLLLVVLQLIIRCIYGFYCRRHFSETSILWCFEKKLIKEMFSFGTWNMWGGMAIALSSQGINVLLNVFFGPVPVAARAIAVQVENAILQFSHNFQMAINPQITKTYAQNNIGDMHKLIHRSARITFILIFILAFPILIEAPFILNLWLDGIVPEYTVTFLSLLIVAVTFNVVSNSLMQAAQATGNIKKYQSVVGIVLLLTLPISYLFLKLGGSPVVVFIVNIIVNFVAFILRMYIVCPMINLSIGNYIKDVILRSLGIVICSMPIPLLLKYILSESLWNEILIFVVTFLVTVFTCTFIGLTQCERMGVIHKINSILNKYIKYKS